jgi:hypothetical protein
MARVQLDATAFVRSGTAVSLQSGIQLNVYHRGTANLATGYTTETGSTTVTYPLSSNRLRGRTNFTSINTGQ